MTHPANLSAKKKCNSQARSTAIGCTIFLFCNLIATGTLNVVLPNMVAKMGGNQAPVGFALMLSIFFCSALSTLGAKLMKKITPKYVALLGSVMAAYIAIYSLAPNLLVVGIGLFMGSFVLAYGTYTSVTALISGQYGTDAPPVLGLVMGIGAFGSTAAAIIISRMVAKFGYEWGVAYTGICIAVISVLAVTFLVRNPAAQEKTAADDETATAAEAEEEVGLALHEARKTASFWLFGVAMLLGSMMFPSVMLYVTSFFVTNGLDETVSANYLAMLTVFAAVVTMTSGVMTKKFGARATIVFLFGGFTVGVVLLCLFPSNPVAWMALLALLLISFGRPVTALPGMVLPEVFGRKDLGAISSSLMTFYFIGGAVSSMLVSAVTDAAGGNFMVSFIMMAGFGVIALVCLLAAQALSPIKRMRSNSGR